MTDRPRVPIPFGGGLDRESGILVVDRTSYADLRNWHVAAGKMELRRGLERIAALTGTHVVAIHPVRARALGVALAYDFASGQVRLYVTDADGGSPDDKGVVAEVDPGSLPPRFLLADVNDRVFIAHDEPSLVKRYPTVIYNVATEALEDFASPFFATAFRGVQRHLNYLVAWGYGTSSDPDRPETLRISMPGQPKIFNPQHYFLVGQQGEAILKCDAVGKVLGIKKLTDSYQLIGYNRANFDVIPLDPNFGQMSSRLSVSVSGVNYFWSEAGPRRTGGGESEDLALPLNLGGPSPDALAAAGDTETAFALYDADKREVAFVFGQWAYVLHLMDESNLRWSYRQYGVALFAGGTLYESVVGSAVTPPAATVTLVAFVSSESGAMTWSWTVSGTTDPGDQIEWWVREKVGPVANTWTRHFVELVAGRSAATTEVTGLFAGEPSDWAVRMARSGVPGPLYASSNPLDWPAAARHIADPLAVTELPDPIVTRTVFYNGTASDTLKIIYQAFDGWYTHISHHVEVSDGAGGWTVAAVTGDIEPTVTANPVDAFAGLTRDVRIRRVTTDGLVGPSGWTVIPAFVFVDDLDPLFTALGTGDVYLADRDLVASPGTNFAAWNGTDTNRNAAVTLSGPAPPEAPQVNAGPPRLTFDGMNDVLGDYLWSIFDGGSLFLVLRSTEAAGARRCVFEQGGGHKPALSYDAAGKLEFNNGGITRSADRHNQWIIVAYTQANGTAAGRGYDGGTPLGDDATADSVVTHPTTMALFHRDNNSEFFKGDVFAFVATPLHLDNTQVAAVYTALKDLATAAGIAVVN